MLKLHTTTGADQGAELGLDELAREGARRMLAAALEAEVAAYVEQHRGERDEAGHALVVRNGRAQPRRLTMGSGTVEIAAPRVNDRRVIEGQRQRFTSEILPRYMRRSPKVAEVLPLLYLRGLSTGDFRAALPALLGEEASAGLSPAVISRLLGAWEAEYRAFRQRDLSERDYVYVWADGVHFRIRLEEDRLCALVMIGVRPDGTKELLAIEDGYRESQESWASLLRGLRDRGMRAPVVAVGDAALGFWAALGEVWPSTREQRCWVHRLANVLDKLPKRLQGKAKEALRQIMNAADRAAAEEGIKAFGAEYGAKYPGAVESLTRDQEKLLTYFDFPAEHWKHLRTTNPIESSFSTVRLRQRVTKGAGSRLRGLVFAYKLLEMAQQRWRKIDAAALLPLVRAGVEFRDGLRVERPEPAERKPPDHPLRSTTFDSTSPPCGPPRRRFLGHERQIGGPIHWGERALRPPTTTAVTWAASAMNKQTGAIENSLLLIARRDAFGSGRFVGILTALDTINYISQG